MFISNTEMPESPLSENPNSLGVLHFQAHSQFTVVQHTSKHTTPLIALNRRGHWSLLRTTWMYAARRAAPSARRDDVNVCCTSRGFLSLTWSLVCAEDDVNDVTYRTQPTL